MTYWSHNDGLHSVSSQARGYRTTRTMCRELQDHVTGGTLLMRASFHNMTLGVIDNSLKNGYTLQRYKELPVIMSLMNDNLI